MVDGRALALHAEVSDGGAVQLTWPQSARTIGLQFELHRSPEAGFVPTASTLVARTPLFAFTDWQSPPGIQYYAVVSVSQEERGEPSYASVDVPADAPPAAPGDLRVAAASGVVHLDWAAPPGPVAGYHVYRREADTSQFEPADCGADPAQ